MRPFLKEHGFPFALVLVFFGATITQVLPAKKEITSEPLASSYDSFTNEWTPPDIDRVPYNKEGELIRYGKELFANTSYYIGPKGSVAAITNGMNCQNCHLNAGTVYFGNCLSAVASTYPVFRARSGVVESVEFRVNDCLKRSLNGHPIDSQSREMRALVAYMEWLGKDVPEEVKPKGANTVEMPYLDRAADPEKGRQVYISRCQRCHGSDGQGSWKPDHTAFIYPPLWGDNSYNTGAGLYRLSRFANYVKYNMPNDSAAYPNAILTDEQAWDVAAFVNSQPRPDKRFPEDWPDISKKSIDHPYGPYTDGFSETQHKYGPFGPIKEARKNLAGK